MERKNYSSGAVWEDLVGYSRAVQMGPLLEVTGTVAIDDHGQLVGKDDPYTQTCCIFERIEKVLTEAGFELEDVIRTRMFVTDISHWEEYGRGHAKFFKTIKPATSMIEVSGLIEPDMLIEIEATAYKIGWNGKQD